MHTQENWHYLNNKYIYTPQELDLMLKEANKYCYGEPPYEKNMLEAKKLLNIVLIHGTDKQKEEAEEYLELFCKSLWVDLKINIQILWKVFVSPFDFICGLFK